MNKAELSCSAARKQLNKIDARLAKEKIIYITRHGKRIFTLVDVEYLEGILETLIIMCDPDIPRLIRESQEDIRCGRISEVQSDQD